MKTKTPSEKDLASQLGPAREIWHEVIASVVKRVGPVEQEWKPSKAGFGWMCLLKQKKRTLLYMTPEKECVQIAIVLGERAVALALASELPEAIKILIREARQYAEGRGIRFPVNSAVEIDVVKKLVVIKTTAK